MFQTRQNETRTRAQLLRQELGETMDHAAKAAGHAAVGMRAAGSRMAPTAGRVRDAASQRWVATVAAFNDTAGLSADDVRALRRVRKQQRALMARGPRTRKKARTRRRLPRMMGLLAAGMAVGAATAMVLRRRRQRWEDYDASEALEAVGATATGLEPGAAGTPAEGTPTGEAAPEPTERTGMTESRTEAYGQDETGGESVDDLVGRARRSSRSARG